jgi:hypothetical protein
LCGKKGNGLVLFGLVADHSPALFLPACHQAAHAYLAQPEYVRLTKAPGPNTQPQGGDVDSITA